MMMPASCFYELGLRALHGFERDAFHDSGESWEAFLDSLEDGFHLLSMVSVRQHVVHLGLVRAELARELALVRPVFVPIGRTRVPLTPSALGRPRVARTA